jgi:hypothetical protein
LISGRALKNSSDINQGKIKCFQREKKPPERNLGHGAKRKIITRVSETKHSFVKFEAFYYEATLLIPDCKNSLGFSLVIV